MSKATEIQITISKSSLVCFLLGSVLSAIVLSVINLNLSLIYSSIVSISSKDLLVPRNQAKERALLTLTKNKNEVIPISNPLKEWSHTITSYLSENHELRGEVLASLHQAIDAKENGKKTKANKLFKHALALDPNHADVLNEYGEFLEVEDILKADHLFTCAVLFNRSHTKALGNLQRTSNRVHEIDKKMLDTIDSKQSRFFQISEGSRVFEKARQEFFYLQIYHTTAIEGNTLTLEQMRHIMETGLAVGGKSLLEHNEVLGMESALQYINDTLMHRIGAITLKDILSIHHRVLGHVDPLEAGHMRMSQVFIGGHVPPPSTQVEDLMEEFVEWLNSDDAGLLHPVEFAAVTHYKLVYIHPFLDGNGRTGRLLMNLILMQYGYPPVVVKLSQRHEYYEMIKMGNLGDIRPFIRFISRCLEAMLDAYIYLDSEPSNSIPEIDDETDIRVLE